MKRILFLVFLGTIWFAPLAPAATKPIQVMLMDGQSAAAYHNWRATTPILKKELEDTGLFQVTVVSFPAWPGDFSNFHPEFSKYKVIVSNLDSPDWPPALQKQFEDYMKRGGGLVIVHAADNAFPNWTAYNLMTGLGGWRGRDEKAGPRWYYKGGKLVSDNTPGRAGMHGQRLPFQVTTRDPNHPVMKGLPPVWMHAPDELYGMLRGPGKNMTVLGTAHSLVTNKGTGNDEPMLMALRYGKGRIFHTTMGHDTVALSCVGFITTYQRGAEWAATGKVTQKVPPDFPTPDKVSLRADIEAMAPPAR
ncbi:MAG TPA: ThuA domain-containing protein [Acidobacteriaceae bacterium]|nr:ThuA domain-containing protein [Acidobacteriaceae bacterium]